MRYSTELIDTLNHIFEEKFSNAPQFIFSPGRINLIGEHTDYNEGFVLPAAIDKGIYLAFKKNDLNHLRIYSFNFDQYIESSLSDLKPSTQGWANYIFGVVAEMQKVTSSVSGFDLVFGGDIPIGSGLSSSAAIECGVGWMMNLLFDLKLDRIVIAKMGQLAEHNFVGVRCGIMDQFASIMGKEDHTIQLDCRSLDYHYFPSVFTDYQIVLLNSKVKHNLAESSYNQRREECEAGVHLISKKFSKVKSLRDVSLEMLEVVKNDLPEILYHRCLFVIEENIRVLKASEKLNSNLLKDLGQLLFQSHFGLSTQYEVSCQELDYLVEKAKDYQEVLGSRMMGGGFGGCTINLVKRSAKEDFIAYIRKAYDERYRIKLESYEVELCKGTHRIDHYGKE